MNSGIDDPAAQVTEGDKYYNGEGAQIDFTQAAAWYEKSAKQGYAQGQYYLGYCYYAGEGVNQDLKAAADWYEKAAQQGHAKAQLKFGNCFYYGEGVEQDLKKAVDWFNKSAGQDESAAQCMLGLCYYNAYGVEQDYKQAVFWWTKSADQGDSQAQFHLGDCYYDGDGVDKDHKKAAFWYAKSAEQNHAQAQFKLAYRYLTGEGVECNHEKGIYWYTKSADQGYEHAQYCLGICYSRGEGAEKDIEKAIDWFTYAAQQGHADSCIELADIYLNKYTGSPDAGADSYFEKGINWFREAAKTGDPQAMLKFAEWLLGEEDYKPVDKNEGLMWLEKAADNNEHDDAEVIWEARWVFSQIYEYGQYNIAKDLKKAENYYKLLVDSGDESAAVYLKMLSQGKEDPLRPRGWSIKHLLARILLKDFPEFDAAGSLYEKRENYDNVEFTDADKEASLPIAERILELADIARRENILAFLSEAEKEKDAYFKTALKLASSGIRADLFADIMNILFVKEKPSGSVLLSRFIIHRGIYLIIRGDFSQQRLKILLGCLYVPRLLLPKNKDRKYKMTFNYLLTHRELPRLYFETINDFYEKIAPSPEMMQRFIYFAYNRSKYFAMENPDIEPAFEIEKFDMYMYEDNFGKSVLVITMPKFDSPPESYQIAIPTDREKAAYYTCEFSVNPLTGEPCFIFGEWDAEQKHTNYGMIDMTGENNFAQMAVEIAYGTA